MVIDWLLFGSIWFLLSVEVGNWRELSWQYLGIWFFADRRQAATFVQAKIFTLGANL